MTKQEEIREGIAQELARIPKGYVGITDPEWHERRLVSARVQAEAVLKYLHSQGVVIKVKGELAEVEEDCPFARLDEQAKMLKAGYVAVEPLIKEG